MDKEYLTSFVDTASPKMLRDFATHFIELLTKTQLNALNSVFATRITFVPPNTQEEESIATEPLSEPESDEEEDLDSEVENLL